MIRVKCPKCAQPLSVSEERAGGVVKCPGCGQVFKVPAAAPRPVPAKPAPSRPAAAKGVPPLQRPPAKKDKVVEMEVIDDEPVLLEGAPDKLPPIRRTASRAAAPLPDRPARFKKKRGLSAGQKTLWALVAIDIGASVILFILYVAKTPLGFVLANTALLPLMYIGIHFFSEGIFSGTLTALILVRAAAAGGLAYLAHIGQDLGRVILGGLLLAQAALGGIGFVIGIVTAIRYKTVGGAQGVIMALIAAIWTAGHGVIGGMLMSGRGLNLGRRDDY